MGTQPLLQLIEHLGCITTQTQQGGQSPSLGVRQLQTRESHRIKVRQSPPGQQPLLSRDLLQQRIEQAVMAVLDQHKARSRTLLAAEQLSLMQRIRKVAGDTITGFSLEEALEFLMRHDDASYVPRGQALQVPPDIEGEALVTRTFVAAAHARHIEVHVWVLNDPREIRSMLELGVDGVMSDSPARALSIARDLGLRA